MSMLEGITHYHLRDYCCLWCKEWGVHANDDETEWVKTAQGATGFIAHSWGGPNPSPFKRAAAAAMAIVACAPIEQHIPPGLIDLYKLDEKSAKHPKMLRAMVGHAFATYVLENSVIGDGGENRELKSPVIMSPHFYKDFLWLLSKAAFEDGRMCGPISLIYEALAYQVNPLARDPVE